MSLPKNSCYNHRMLTALSPLDGRYADKVQDLGDHFSEQALIWARLEVEVHYFIALSQEGKITDLPKVTDAQKKALYKILTSFNTAEAKKVKTIERTTNHDVKAVEYYLKKEIAKIPGLKKSVEFVHFGLTSEDVNNLSYGMMVHGALKRVLLPELKKTIADLQKLASKWKKVKMLSLTHGQPATPDTLGRQLQVFVDRLQRQEEQLKKFRMQGKFGGAVGNYAAHRMAYPDVNWESFGRKFVKSLKLDPLAHTHQSNPHDDYAELCHIVHRTNSIMLDLSRDCWLYIMRGVFKQKTVKGEVGSSTMPHKVNPIDFENAEGNIGLSNALCDHFANKLPVSRMQRDLSDSTVQRNLGVAFGYHVLAEKSLRKGLGKLALNPKRAKAELYDHPEVLAEAIQMILRRRGVEGAYEKLKAVTRGEEVTLVKLLDFMEKQGFSKDEMERVMSLIR